MLFPSSTLDVNCGAVADIFSDTSRGRQSSRPPRIEPPSASPAPAGLSHVPRGIHRGSFDTWSGLAARAVPVAPAPVRALAMCAMRVEEEEGCVSL